MLRTKEIETMKLEIETMKLSELEGRTLRVNISQSHIITAVLKEIRPIGFFFLVTESDSSDYHIGQYVFMSISCPVIFSTIEEVTC
jgi:hypothetical protein